MHTNVMPVSSVCCKVRHQLSVITAVHEWSTDDDRH